MEDTNMDANVSSSGLFSGGVPPVSNITSSCVQLQSTTPAVTVEYLNHDPEPGEIVDVVPQAIAPSPPPSPDGDVSPPPTLTASSSFQPPNGSASSSHQNASSGGETGGSARSNSSSSPVANPIASDHCYGLPYQDHNYGSASSYSSNRNNSGNGNCSNGNNGSNNGVSYSSGSQRHPSGSHRLSISSGGNGSPAQGNRLLSGGSTPTVGAGVFVASRRLVPVFTNGNNSRPPTLPHYGPSTTASDSRISPSIGSYAVDRISFSDDDGPGNRSDSDGLLSSGISAPLLSPVAGNSPTASSSMAISSNSGNGLTILGQSGITVTTSSQVQVRGRLRSIGTRPLAEESVHGYHGTPAIHPRLAPPNPSRLGVSSMLPSHGPLPISRSSGGVVTSKTIGTNFNSILLPPGPASLQKYHQPAFSHYPIKPPSVSGATSFAFPRQGVLPNVSLPTANGSGQQPPPKKPGRPRIPKPGAPPRQQTMQIPGSIPSSGAGSNMTMTKTPRRRKLSPRQPGMHPFSPPGGPPPGIYATGVHQQPPGTPFSPSGLMGQPSILVNRTTQPNAAVTTSSVDTVSSVLEAVAAGWTTPSSLPLPLLPPYHQTSLQHPLGSYHSSSVAQQRPAHSLEVGGPLMVGTSPVIPAHPMFNNVAASVSTSVSLMGAGIMSSQQQQQQQQQQSAPIVPTQEKPTTSPSSTGGTAIGLGKQEFRDSYNNIMSELYHRIGISDKDDDLKPKSKPGARSSPFSKNDQRLASSFREAKAKPRGRQKKLKLESGLGEGTSAAVMKTELMDGAKSAVEKASNGKLSGDDGLNTSTDEEGDSSADEWEGKDYTTRCLCEMQHNDEFMIQCDRCEVWQHCECMGLDTKNIPDNYLCERCDPRSLKLTQAEAQRLQQAKVLQWKRKKAAAAARRRRRMASASRASMSSSSSAIAGNRGRPRKSVDASSSIIGRKRTISSGDANANKRFKLSNSPGVAGETFTEATRNVCTAKVSKAIRASGDTVGASNQLAQLPSEPPCKSMFVAVGRQGLVATDTVLPDLPIIEYRGKVCWSTDFEIPDGNGGRVPIIAPYLLYYRSGGADGSDVFSVCVDARHIGTSARFVRRSCQPNSQVTHVVCNGALHMLLVSTEMIECGAEITIPFDFDISKCNFELECACSNSPLLTPNLKTECPVQIHNRALPPHGTIHGNESNGGNAMFHVLGASNQLQPVKRRPGRPPGSGKTQHQQEAGNRGITTSATTAAARKKSKKARGFKVRIVGKKKTSVLDGNAHGGGKVKSSKLKLRQPERVGKKFKPTATADLTKRRFSEERPGEFGLNGSESAGSSFGRSPTNTPAPGTSQKHGGAKLSRTKSTVSPTASLVASTAAEQQEHLSREERKMQALMEQISRMEQREQKKAEKKMAKIRGDGGNVIKPVKQARKTAAMTDKKVKLIGRRKSATMDRTVAAARRKRAESEATVWSAAKRPRLLSENGETSSSISSLESDDHDMEVSMGRTIGQQSTSRSGYGTEKLSLLQATTALADLKNQSKAYANVNTTSPPLAQHPKAGDVAKKRWLRQAMEETSKSSASTSAAVHVDTKTGDIAPPMQISPSSTVAPPKKRIIQEFSHSALTTPGDVLPSRPTDARPSSSTTSKVQQSDIQEGPMSTVEAAQLLAEMHHHQVMVTQKSVEPADAGTEWMQSSAQDRDLQHAPSALKMIYPEEQPPSVHPVESEVGASSSIPLSVLATTIAAGNVANFTAPPYFTSSVAPVGGDQSNVLANSYPVSTASTSLLYSAIEDDVPMVPSGLTMDSTQPLAEILQPVQKKKVKITIDEYSKRKRESVNEITPTTPNIESADASPTSASVPTPATSGTTPAVERQHSFIPQIKDGDVASRNIRLSSVPDPETIGKSSATLDDLRKRIYNRTYGRKQPQVDATVQEATTTAAPPPQSPIANAPSVGTEPKSEEIVNSVKEPSTPPRDSTAAVPADSMEDSPDVTVHRLSLTDRLRVEFGLD